MRAADVGLDAPERVRMRQERWNARSCMSCQGRSIGGVGEREDSSRQCIDTVSTVCHDVYMTNNAPAAATQPVTIIRSKTGTQTHLGRKNSQRAYCGTIAPRVLVSRPTYAEAVEYAQNLRGASLCQKCFPHHTEVTR